VLVFAAGLVPMGAPIARAGGSLTYTVRLDAQPPGDEPWAFNRMFPDAIRVHKGDVIDAAWDGAESPHTASFVPTSDPEGWRQQNQGPGGPWAFAVPDSSVGGDDPTEVINPSVLYPTSFACGDASNPCSFDGSGVVSSGFQFSDPAAQPSLAVKIVAPRGTYSLLCLVHVGMEIPLQVVGPSQSIPSPSDVNAQAARQQERARTVDGAVADAQAQQVVASNLGGGHIQWTISAGGFYRQVTANEYLDAGLTVHVGDAIKVTALPEIHTATFPLSAVDRVPFVTPVCEQPGKDHPAGSPFDCADPADFQVELNPVALQPTDTNQLRNPNHFVNSGLIVGADTHTFVAKKPGTYSMVCLVHGPEMSTTIKFVG
jgi:plastocyanin